MSSVFEESSDCSTSESDIDQAHIHVSVASGRYHIKGATGVLRPAGGRARNGCDWAQKLRGLSTILSRRLSQPAEVTDGLHPLHFFPTQKARKISTVAVKEKFVFMRPRPRSLCLLPGHGSSFLFVLGSSCSLSDCRPSVEEADLYRFVHWHWPSHSNVRPKLKSRRSKRGDGHQVPFFVICVSALAEAPAHLGDCATLLGCLVRFFQSLSDTFRRLFKVHRAMKLNTTAKSAPRNSFR